MKFYVDAILSAADAKFELVGIVEDGCELVKAARDLNPDVIIADISMPHLNGIDAMAQLKQHNPQLRLVFLTMHRDPAYAQSAKRFATTLNLSARTVEDHKYRLMETLGIENSAELIRFAIKHGLGPVVYCRQTRKFSGCASV